MFVFTILIEVLTWSQFPRIKKINWVVTTSGGKDRVRVELAA